MQLTINIFSNIPIIYILMTIIVALIIWFVIENIKNKNYLLQTRKKTSNIKKLDILPIPCIYYDLSYQFIGMNQMAHSDFNKKNVYTKFETLPLNRVFDSSDLSNRLDELVIYEKPQSFELSQHIGDVKFYYQVSITIINIDKNKSKLIVLFLQEITSLKKEIKKLNNKLTSQQALYSNLIGKQNESETQKTDLEKAFKRSSKHHIQLQKALLENEKQRNQLQDAVEVINKQKEELKQANEEIKQHSKMKEIFFANTSHEIRTPLNAIIGFTNLLIQKDPLDRQLNYLKNIKASGDNLLIVVNDILDFSKIEAGKMTFENISFLITEQVEHLFSTMQIKAKSKKIKLLQNIDPFIPEVLIGDPTRLNQILINLIGNAIKFTNPNGRIKLTISERKRTNTHINLKFEIKDNGIGISEEKMKTIFDSFTQAENETTRKYGGTGLGLSIVKQLVELQNGEISVKSELHKGSTFTIYLNFAIGHFSSIKNNITSKDIDLENVQNIWLLLAEDNIINQELAIDTIKNWIPNINIDIALNGKEVIDKITNNHYHMIFMDIQMPEIDGIEATRYIRTQLPINKKYVPIIAMTAHALKNERKHFMEVGMNDYISKPFSPKVLIQKIVFYSQQSIQERVKSGKPLNANQEMYNINEDNEINKAEEKSPYQYLDLNYFEKIYKNNNNKIKKILKMYIDSVQNEIDKISNAYNNRELKVTQAKAHTLKPKMSYIGCTELSENLKEIEQAIKQNCDISNLAVKINNLKDKWPLIEKEINHFLNN